MCVICNGNPLVTHKPTCDYICAKCRRHGQVGVATKQTPPRSGAQQGPNHSLV